MTTTVLFAFAVVGLVNLCYYLGFLKFALSSSQLPKSNDSMPVSVVICAKNEAENLRKFLPDVLSQEYPDFEVVVINDASTDDTLEVIEQFKEQDPRVQVVDVRNNEAFWANKKYALTLGIKKAANPYLVFTDADCRPESNQWLSRMSAGFSENKNIILGYGGYFHQPGSLLNKLVRFETLLTAIQYFSYALLGTPYMGVGRNLAYTSNLFYKQNGFASHLQLRSGDDDLFVNEAATPSNTAICTDANSITRSFPKQRLRSWFNQKRRHASVAGHYRKRHQFLLGLFYLTQLLFWILLVPLLLSPFWKLALIIFSLRLLVQGVVFYQAGKKLGEKDLIWFFPLLELFLVWAQIRIFIANKIAKPTHWK